MTGWNDHAANQFSVRVVFVPNLKNEFVGKVTDLDLVRLVPLRIEVVENDGGLGQLGLAQTDVDKRVRDVLAVSYTAGLALTNSILVPFYNHG